jgi:hypothetical protein
MDVLISGFGTGEAAVPLAEDEVLAIEDFFVIDYG